MVDPIIEVVCRAARKDTMAGKGKKSEQRKKLVKKLAKKVIKKVKKEEKKSNYEVDRSDVKPIFFVAPRKSPSYE